MRKKLLITTLTIFMVLSLAACGSDKKDSDETDAMKTVAEETTVEESTEETTVEESAEETAAEETSEKETVEESATEEPTVEETKTAEFELSQMDSGFYGGIAWATVADDTGTKKVLINKDLQIVYELPEGMETGDIFDGKAVVIHSDQESNPGFMIVGADGTVLYECSDNLGEYDHNVSLTKDGGAVYDKLESGLTGSAYACVLNDEFETVAQVEIPFDRYRVRYLYLSDGVYCFCDDFEGRILGILNVKDNTSINLQDNNSLVAVYDMDRCVGFKDPYRKFYVIAENLDFSGVTDLETLSNLLEANKYESASTYFVFNHGYIGYDYDLDKNYIEGFTIPDFGARINTFQISKDGKYVALQLSGADGNCYYTVVNSDGQSLYEPMQAAYLDSLVFANDGYIMDWDGSGITPDGKEFQLGDGTALSGIGENPISYVGDSIFVVSDGYIFCVNKLYQLDGTEVTTVTALN